MNNFNMRRFLAPFFCGFIILLSLWYILSAIINLPILPSPIVVIRNIFAGFLGLISIHAASSLFRIAAGLVMGVAFGLPLGIAMGYFKNVRKILSPVVYLAYPVPKIALLPGVMLAFGVGEISKIVIIFLIIFFQIVVAVRDAVQAIPAETYYPLYSLGASFKDVFLNVLFPASLPKFLTSLRVAMATAISVLFFTETFGTVHGMGYFIMDAWQRVNYVDMYSGIVVLSSMGLALFLLLDMAERIFCDWQYHE